MRKTIDFCIAFVLLHASLTRSEKIMNSELCRQALAKIGNPNVLVNIISRRVRQLTTGGGAFSRPLITDTAAMGAADIALVELIEDKIGWELMEKPGEEGHRTPVRKRKRSS